MVFLYTTSCQSSSNQQLTPSSEMRTWSNTVAVKAIPLWDLFSLGSSLVYNLLHFLRSPKPSTSLLVHLCSRRHSIDGQKEELLGFDDGEEMRDVGEDGQEDGFFRDSEGSVVIVRVGAVMDDSVHVQICREGVNGAISSQLGTTRRRGSDTNRDCRTRGSYFPGSIAR